MKRFLLGLALAAIASAAFGDELVMNRIVKDGSFQGFDKNKFHFLTAKGKFMNEQASRVTKLVLPKPKKATYLTSSSKKEETGLLKGFDKQKFTFVKDGKEVIVAQSKMKKIEVRLESEGGGGKSGTAGGYPIPPVDPNAFTGDLSPDQQAALDKFKESKKTFDDYVRESAGIVSEMDRTTGAAREEYLNQLRKRKLDEQPLRKDLVAAYDALVQAFSENSDEPSKPSQPAKGGKAQVKSPAKQEESAPVEEAVQPEESSQPEEVAKPEEPVQPKVSDQAEKPAQPKKSAQPKASVQVEESEQLEEPIKLEW